MPRKLPKPRIALMGSGTLGGGPVGEGIPVLTDLFERLSNYYEITFYSFAPVSLSQIPKAIRVWQPISIRFPGRLKYLLLFLIVLWDHFIRPYSLIFSVSIHPTGPYAVILGRILRKPVLIQLIASEAVNLEDIGCGNLTTPGLIKISKQVCGNANILVTVAEYQKQLALATFTIPREIAVLPLRVNPDNFLYRKRKLSHRVRFIQVGYYSPIKDQDTVFEAFSIVAKKIDCHLTVVGRGFDSPVVRALLNKFNIADKVRCVGFISQVELRKYYDEADILLHAARFETGCAVIQEAMASGLAVCGTQVGILADIGDAYAVVVPARNPAKLAEGILGLVNNPEKYERITDSAYRWITQFDARWSARGYREFIDKIVLKAD